MNLGWTVVEVGWDLTVPQGGALFGIHPAGGEKPRWIIGCAFRLAIPPLGRSVLALRIEPSTSIISRGTESLLTLRWWGESRANQSLNWVSGPEGFRPDSKTFVDDSGGVKGAISDPDRP